MMAPLLQGPLINPHATLITLFMNAVPETMTMEEQRAVMSPHGQAMRRLLKFLPMERMPMSPYDPAFVKMSYASSVVAAYDHIFDR
jgi:hypothetical protein